MLTRPGTLGRVRKALDLVTGPLGLAETPPPPPPHALYLWAALHLELFPFSFYPLLKRVSGSPGSHSTVRCQGAGTQLHIGVMYVASSGCIDPSG